MDGVAGFLFDRDGYGDGLTGIKENKHGVLYKISFYMDMEERERMMSRWSLSYRE